MFATGNAICSSTNRRTKLYKMRAIRCNDEQKTDIPS